MPLTVVIGGQFGSEGKGKLAHWIVQEHSATIAVRVGGPNSGHTALDAGGRPHVFFHLPTAALLGDVRCVLAAGSYINPKLLLAEVEECGLSPARVCVDPKATLVTDEDAAYERASTLRQSVGSTLSGTGSAVLGRIARSSRRRLAEDCADLVPFLADTASMLRAALDRGERVVLEGTQGFGLSLLHSPHYPFVTSRDTTASAVVAEVGLSPLDVDEVVLVLRAFPIRVGGNSGPLPNEISWDIVTHESGAAKPIAEFTSVTGRVRRVAHFSPDIVRQAIRANQPTRLVMNHLDYIDQESGRTGEETTSVNAFLEHVEAELGRSIDLCGFGPGIVTPRRVGSKDTRVS
jgi:adenylosuccinate synthase